MIPTMKMMMNSVMTAAVAVINGQQQQQQQHFNVSSTFLTLAQGALQNYYRKYNKYKKTSNKKTSRKGINENMMKNTNTGQASL